LIGVVVFFARRKRTKEEPIYHFRCKSCKRRLRYMERQIGHKGQCSNCGKDLIFPPLSEAVD
jgi:hypothetical protein